MIAVVIIVYIILGIALAISTKAEDAEIYIAVCLFFPLLLVINFVKMLYLGLRGVYRITIRGY